MAATELTWTSTGQSKDVGSFLLRQGNPGSGAMSGHVRQCLCLDGSPGEHGARTLRCTPGPRCQVQWDGCPQEGTASRRRGASSTAEKGPLADQDLAKANQNVPLGTPWIQL